MTALSEKKHLSPPFLPPVSSLWLYACVCWMCTNASLSYLKAISYHMGRTSLADVHIGLKSLFLFRGGSFSAGFNSDGMKFSHLPLD